MIVKYILKLTDTFSFATSEKITKDISLDKYLQLEKMKDKKIPINEFKNHIRYTWLINSIDPIE